ncbi:class E vacuolar protein-sorting machinery protein hse1-like isoform X2 [Sander lucioperca]|uniref:class E vacuolar protein-sorting machinery protein hse1-like isoform X2 n=1 Tax=Sander lucioperca TaxID=283035 RepID=UPI0016538FCD|nr:class E vacuolar protein-sorting machinery protein hse1-like isoform X2 [Sander lucioperca]
MPNMFKHDKNTLLLSIVIVSDLHTWIQTGSGQQLNMDLIRRATGPYTSVEDSVLNLCFTIFRTVEKVKVNRERCHQISDRVKSLERLVLTIKQKGSGQNSAMVEATLRDLCITLDSVATEMEKLSKTSALKNALKSNQEDKFWRMDRTLTDILHVLSGTLNIEQGNTLYTTPLPPPSPMAPANMYNPPAPMNNPSPMAPANMYNPPSPMNNPSPMAPANMYNPPAPMNNPSPMAPANMYNPPAPMNNPSPMAPANMYNPPAPMNNPSPRAPMTMCNPPATMYYANPMAPATMYYANPMAPATMYYSNPMPTVMCNPPAPMPSYKPLVMGTIAPRAFSPQTTVISVKTNFGYSP